MATPKSTQGNKDPKKPAAAKAASSKSSSEGNSRKSTSKTTAPVATPVATPAQTASKEPWYRNKIFAFCAILIVVVLVALLAYKAFNPSTQNVVKVTETTGTTIPISLVTTATTTASTSTVQTEPVPFTTEGAQSWTEWMAKANAQKDQGKLGMWRALADLHFNGKLARAYAAVQYQVTKESVLGLDYYVRTVPSGGMPVLNTSPKGKTYVPIPNSTLKAGDTYLVLDKDSPFVKAAAKDAKKPTDSGKEVPAIRRKCANPIKVGGSVTKSRRPRHCTNNTGQYRKHGRQNPGKNVGGTKGYKPRDNAETVVAQQADEPVGGTTPTTYGTPGTGSGGTTPGGPGTGDPVANPGTGVDIGGAVAPPN